MKLILERRPARRVSPRVFELPFEANARFNPHWWHRIVHYDVNDWFGLVNEVGVEVARAEVKPHARLDDSYPSAGAPEDGFAQITFFEVRADLRGQGIGPRAIDLLTGFYPGRRLAALSEADAFWRGLGWASHPHDVGPFEEPSVYQTLFTSPP